MVKKIILDTNFLIYCVQYKIDIEKEIERIMTENYTINILDGTIDELNKLKERKTKLPAKIALKLVENFNIIETKKAHIVDELIVEIADKNTIVGTNDKELKSRLKCQILVVRKKSHLELI